MKVICIGSSTKDIIFPITSGETMETLDDIESQMKIVFELGAKYQVSERRHESIGGCAANVACGLGRLGLDVYCCTRVGNDSSGAWMKDELKKNGVFIDLIQVGEDHQSDLSAIIAHVPSEDRIVFSDRDANEKLEILPDSIRKIEAEWFFLSSLNGNSQESWDKKLDKILDLAKEENIKLILNPGQKNIKNNPQKIIETLSQLHILLVNKDEAIEIVDKLDEYESELLNDEKFLAEKLHEAGSRVIVITDGIKGAWGFDGEQFLHVDARKEKVADSLGAGDAFSSGFVAAYIRGKELAECLEWGIANASSVVRYYGAIKGLLDVNHI